MAAAKVDPQTVVFKKYIQDKRILIADTSATARASLSNILVGLGAKSMYIALASDFKSAEEEILRTKPKLVITDYDLGKKCGLELLFRQRAQQSPDVKDSLFIITTGNSSQSAVAKAAEEEIDSYILKPFSANTLRDTILRVAISKINPSAYVKMIEKGKKELQGMDFDAALATFEEAVKLDPTPSLACAYLGQSQQLKEALDNAAGSYAKGLTYNKIHYKCLVGLFEMSLLKKQYVDAYEVVKKLSQYFPANPKRLTQVLKLAILTKSYEDVEKYYQLFTKIDERDEDVTRHICAALVICGKYYLQQSHGIRAVELFTKAAVSASGRPKILQEIIIGLLDGDLAKEADKIMKRFHPSDQSTPTYLALELMVADRQGIAPGVIIDRGRKLIAKDLHDPLLYHLLIRKNAQAGLAAAAEMLLAEGCKRWPDRAPDFQKAATAVKVSDKKVVDKN